MTWTFDCEEQMDNFELSGECTLWEGAPDNPTRIIRTDEKWGVDIKWTANGGLVNSLGANKWHIECYLEKWGPDEGPALNNPAPVQVKPIPGHHYDVHHEFDPLKRADAGCYKMAVLLKLVSDAGIPCPVACIAEGDLIDFYVADWP